MIEATQLSPTVQHFTNQLLDRLQAAHPQQPPRFFSIGPTTLRVIFVGTGNPCFFTDAIAHRAIAAVDAYDLTIYVVDYQTSGMMLPPPGWDWQQVDGHGIITTANRNYAGNFQQAQGVFTWLAYQEQIAVLWLADLETLPEWERSFPFRFILHKWLENNDRYVLVHAGAVGLPTGGVLLTGRGGSGKSTSTLACLNSRLLYAGDDFVLIDLETRFVHSLYTVAKVTHENLNRFPHLRPLVSNPEAAADQKLQVFLHRHYPMAITAGFPLKAILLPTFTGGLATAIRPATAADTLKALAPSTMALLKADQQTFLKLTRLIKQAPAYWLDTGTDLTQIPDTILTLLQPNSSTSLL